MPLPSLSCQNCVKAGLSILPTRYTVIPQAVSATIPKGITGKRVTDIKLTEHRYALRVLRLGFLYIFYDQGARGAKYWEVYSVSENGLLYRQLDPASARDLSAASFAPNPTCARQGHNIPCSVIVIEKPEKCPKLWIAFSEHKWADETIARYASSQKHRDARMQILHPATWIKTYHDPHALVAEKTSIEQVLEYMPGFDGRDLRLAASPISKSDGSFNATILKSQTTRYPLHLRNNEAVALATKMVEQGKKPQGAPYQPMLLALWDGIGIAHELNGFRNDSAGWLKKYGDERELEVTALADINGAKAALEKHAFESQKSVQDRMLGNAANAYDTKEMARHRQNAANLPEPRRSQQLQVYDIMEDWAKRQVPSLGYVGRLNYANQFPEPQRTQEISKIRAEVDKFTQTRAKNYQTNLDDVVKETWPKYADCLDTYRLEAFEKNYKALLAQVKTLQDRRADDIVAWLKADLFIDTLEDYHDQNLADGVVFESVVSDAIFGLSSSETGANHIDTMVKSATTQKPGSLIWRAVALNQKEGAEALDAALAYAQSHQGITLAEGLRAAETPLKTLKSLADLYKKAQSFYNTALTAQGKGITSFNSRGVDQLAITVGDNVFRWLRVDKLGNYVGESLLRHIFLLRSFVDQSDALALIEAEAKASKIVDEQRLQRLATAKVFLESDSLHASTSSNEAKSLRDAWNGLKSSEKGVSAVKDMRLATIVGFIEAANFIRLMSVTDKNSKTYAQLVASGMSVTSACLDVASARAKLLLGESALTYQKLKLGGGLLSAGASAIGAVLDAKEIVKNISDRDYKLAGLYGMKTGLSAANVYATTKLSLSYSGPLIEKLAGRIVAEEIATSLGARAAAITVGRLTLMAIGWEVTASLLIIQLIIWKITPNDLQEWCDLSAFGKHKNGTQFQTAKTQVDKFGKAIVAVF